MLENWQKGVLIAVTLVPGVELKYEKVRNIDVKVVKVLGFMGFFEVFFLPVL